MISKDDVKKLSALSRIEFSEKEEDGLTRDLQSVLEYFEKLKGAFVVDLPTHVSDEYPEGKLRKDEASDEAYSDVAGLVSAVPETEDGYIKVKPVFER